MQREQRMHMEKFMLAFKMWPARQRNYAMWLLLLLLPLALNPLAFVILFVYIEICVCAHVCVCVLNLYVVRQYIDNAKIRRSCNSK